MAKEWYEDFFSGIALDLWDNVTTPDMTRDEVDFMERFLECRSGSALLDVPCGSGRHSIEMSRRGYSMTGIDLSPENIERAGKSGKGQRVEWICKDMRHLDFSAKFDGAFCLGNSFAYTTYEDTLKFLSGVARALKPGGRFILNTGIATECILPHYAGREVYPIGDIEFVVENKYNSGLSCLETDYIFTRAGKTERRHGRQFVYTAAEIGRMFTQMGLIPRSFLGSLDGKPFKLGDQQLFVVAQK